jgi:subtilase family serine protease
MLRNSPSRIVFAFLASFIGISTSFAAVPDRITTQVSVSNRATLAGSVHPKAKSSTDLGAAPAGKQLTSMSLRFSMTPAQQSALNQLLIDQQNPGSPQYRQWLTPAQYGAHFGLSSADIAKVTSWLTSEGLTVTGVSNSSTFVTFDGTVAQVDAAFGTSIHSLSFKGVSHFANLSDVSLPSAVQSVVMDVTGLHDFRLHPHIQQQTVDPLHPKFTSQVSQSHYVVPGDFYQIYNETPALANSINGTGIKIGIMGQVSILPADIAAFRSAAGLSASAPTVVTPLGAAPSTTNNCSSSTSSTCPSPNLDDLSESSLDVEWAGGVAPGATILFADGADIFFNSLTGAVDQNLAPILSISYGECEPGWGTSDLNTLNQLFAQANAQGQTILGPAGDSGATDCDTAEATNGLTVDFPASSPYVTGMGGLMFNEGSATGGTAYWLATDGALTEGTAVPNADYSAISYMPETVWNDYTYTGSEYGGGGGGTSQYFTKPYWQQGTGVPADAARDVPDLALNASDAHDPYLYCSNGSCAVGFRTTTNGGLTAAGGTSFSTPAFAGILALVEQKTGSRGLGNVNPTIYALANSKYYVAGANFSTNSSVVFNDVTAGNNDNLCAAATPECASGGLIGYSAGSGYDQASGWGSVNVNNLINDWSLVTPIASTGATGATTSTTSVTTSAGSVTAGASVVFTATVTGSAGTPTGTVTFLVNNAVVGTGTLTNGQATYTYTTSCANLYAMLERDPSTTVIAGLYASENPKPSRVSRFGAGSGIAAAGLLLLFLPRKRRLSGILVLLLSVAIVLGETGCSSNMATATGATTTTTNSNGITTGKVLVSASYSGNSTYAGSIASGITSAGFTTTANSVVTPISVSVTVGTCTAI